MRWPLRFSGGQVLFRFRIGASKEYPRLSRLADASGSKTLASQSEQLLRPLAAHSSVEIDSKSFI